jgi:glyoxylase-like metal-dependent hydrolase (beta-lactamase superfamily II)
VAVTLDLSDLHAPALTGELRRLAPNVVRLVASNPSALTGAGTNCYIVGTGPDYVVVDPGPGDAGHVERMLAATGGRISHVLCTHSHPDHSPGAAALKSATGALVLGRPAPDDGYQDESYRPDATLTDGDLISAAGANLRALHTPGHASNHVCLLLEPEGWLLTGDHLMGGSTVVILPPDGSMRLYLESLRRLRTLPLAALLPGHGAVIADPLGEIDRVLAHRMQRESKVIEGLTTLGGAATLDALVPVVYADTPVRLHPLARHSLLAHLQKLLEERRVAQDGEHWTWLAA